MQLGLLGALSSFFSLSSKEREVEVAAILQEKDHSYLRGDIPHRGPCPGLNSLANQGYL